MKYKLSIIILALLICNCALFLGQRYYDYKNEPICIKSKEICKQANDIRKTIKDKNNDQLKQIELECDSTCKKCTKTLDSIERGRRISKYKYRD
jgi:hypothetical protein